MSEQKPPSVKQAFQTQPTRDLISLGRELAEYSKVRHVPARQPTAEEIAATVAEFAEIDRVGALKKPYPRPRRTSPRFPPAALRTVLNVDDNNLQIGIVFEVAGETVGYALDLVSAWEASEMIAAALRDHVSRFQALSSWGIPSFDGSKSIGQSEVPSAKA